MAIRLSLSLRFISPMRTTDIYFYFQAGEVTGDIRVFLFTCVREDWLATAAAAAAALCILYRTGVDYFCRPPVGGLRAEFLRRINDRRKG